MPHLALLEDGKLLDVENISTFQFTGRLQLRQALRVADNIHPDGNKYLALLGDTVIKLVLVKVGLRGMQPVINNIVSEKASNAYLAQ
ncbi:hypothetical protein BBP40_001435 [Aspergillus hancockii]|nr:hypothetical protein BBP40_001435 [Aspergillus hancockii]